MTDEEKKERLEYLQSIECVHPEKCMYKISCQKDYIRMWQGATQEKQCLDFVKNIICELDAHKFLKIKVNEAAENLENSGFPDFIFEDGFIEHFEITASDEGSKGSDYRRTEAKHKRALSKATQGAVLRPQHSSWSYDNLKKSLQRNWENHIESLQGSLDKIQSSTTKVFMMEHLEMNIEMFENVYAYTDDYSIKQRHFRYYSLSHDVEMLDYIYNFRDKVDYVIYRHNSGVEVIEIANIPNLKETLKFPFIKSPSFQVRGSIKMKVWEESSLKCFHSLCGNTK